MYGVAGGEGWAFFEQGSGETAFFFVYSETEMLLECSPQRCEPSAAAVEVHLSLQDRRAFNDSAGVHDEIPRGLGT